MCANKRLDEVATDAFEMCSGQANALPNTHKTITATVILQTSMPSIVVFPSSSTKSSSSALITTISSTSLVSSTTIQTRLSSSTAPQSRTSATGAPTATAAADQTPVAKSLTKSQVEAITASAIGGAAFLFALIVLFTCLRRRRRRARDSDMLPFQSDPEGPKFGFRTPLEIQKEISSNKKGRWKKFPRREPSDSGFRTPMEIRREISMHGNRGPKPWGWSPPVPPRLETSDPYMFARSSIKADTIGLAISPERNPLMEDVRSSKLLPEKPALTLNTTRNEEMLGNGLQTRPQVYPQVSRQSTATQFEEDEETTSPDETYKRGPNQKALSLLGLSPAPERSQPQTIKIVPPDSSDDPFFTDSNDSHKNQYAPSPQYTVKPLKIARGVGSFSRPLAAQGQNLQLQVPHPTASQNPQARPVTASSSVYSSGPNTPYASNTAHLTQNPSTLAFPLPPRSPPEAQPRQRRSYQQPGPYDRASAGSMTSFDSSSSLENEPGQRNTLMMDLSPVVESPSPASPTGISPVTYPKVKRLSQQIKSIRMVPPPPQPNFASVFSSGAGGTHRNMDNGPITNGTGQHVRNVSGGGQEKPWQAAERAAALQRSQSRLAPQPQLQQPRTPPSQTQHTQQNPKLRSPFQPRLQQPPQARLAPSQREYIAPSAHFNNSLHPGHARHGSLTPSIASQNSTSSSLLAKRLGAEKAAQLQLATGDEDVRRQPGSKWRVLGKEEQERAKAQGWRPQLAKEINQVVYLGERADEGLPKTPGWVPKLTPTRRGDELFLSVA
jgi:hypothetical protein